MTLKVTACGIEVDGEVQITVDAMLELTNDDKTMIELDGEVMRIKDAYNLHGGKVIDLFGMFERFDENEPRIWIATKRDA